MGNALHSRWTSGRRPKHWLAGLTLALGLAITFTAPVGAQEQRAGLALVIGVSDYESFPDIRSPAADANLVADSLADIGFETTLVLDPTGDRFKREIGRFSRDVRDAKNPVVVFYFAGHGAQRNRVNYLFGSDADLDDVERTGINLVEVLAGFKTEGATNINFIDAAFGADTYRFDPSQSGLATIEAEPDTLTIFSTSPDAVALSGEPNSPFALAVAKYLPVPGSVIELDNRIRRDVLEQTSGRQVPWSVSNMSRDLYLVAPEPENGKFPQRPDTEIEVSSFTRELLKQLAKRATIPAEDVEVAPLLRAGRALYETSSGELKATYEDGSFALLVGVSDYDPAGEDRGVWDDLPSVKDELAELADVLKNVHGFNVKTVMNPIGETLVKEVNDFVNEHSPKVNARILFFFSGHGDTIVNRATGRRSAFFVPRDAPRYQDSRAVFSNTALNMARVSEWLELIEAKHVMWVFDSCFSGEALRMANTRSGFSPYMEDLHTRSVRRIITAGSENEKVPAKSRFAQQFARVLRGEVEVGDRDPIITGDELGDFLKRDIIDFSRDSGTPQHPQSDTVIIPDSESGDIIFRIEPELIANRKP